jgi:O-antigen ligase
MHSIAINLDARQTSRALALALRGSVAAIVAAVVLFGFTAETQPYLYGLIGASLVVYAIARGPLVVTAAVEYASARSMRWRWAFLLWAAASLLWAVNGDLALDRAITLLEIQIVGLVLFDACRNLGLFPWVLRVTLVTVFVGVLHALVSGQTVVESARLKGVYGNPNMFATTIVMGLACFHAGVDAAAGRAGRLLSHALALVMLMGVLAAASVKGLAGALTVWGLGAVVRRVRRRALVQVAVVLVGGIVAVSALAPLTQYWEKTLYRSSLAVAAFQTSAGASNSLVERIRFIRKGVDLIEEAPIGGHGLHAFQWLSGEGTYAHNNYVDLGVGVGVVGVILFYAFHLSLLVGTLLLRGQSSPEGRFIIILVPALMAIDMATVSYVGKLPTLLLISAAGWLESRATVSPQREGVTALS